MTQPDPLNTTPWKPIDLDWGEGETVRVLDPDEIRPASSRRLPANREEEVEPGPAHSPVPIGGNSLSPARLITRDNAIDNHTQRVNGLTTALKTADDFLSVPKTGARDWAADLRYGDPIIERINDAVALIHEALDLIDIHENG